MKSLSLSIRRVRSSVRTDVNTGAISVAQPPPPPPKPSTDGTCSIVRRQGGAVAAYGGGVGGYACVGATG